jgi:hypothetical protein
MGSDGDEMRRAAARAAGSNSKTDALLRVATAGPMLVLRPRVRTAEV